MRLSCVHGHRLDGRNRAPESRCRLFGTSDRARPGTAGRLQRAGTAAPSQRQHDPLTAANSTTGTVVIVSPSLVVFDADDVRLDLKPPFTTEKPGPASRVPPFSRKIIERSSRAGGLPRGLASRSGSRYGSRHDPLPAPARPRRRRYRRCHPGIGCARAAEAAARSDVAAEDRRRLSDRLSVVGRLLRARPQHEMQGVPQERRNVPGRLHDVVRLLRRDGMPVAMMNGARHACQTSQRKAQGETVDSRWIHGARLQRVEKAARTILREKHGITVLTVRGKRLARRVHHGRRPMSKPRSLACHSFLQGHAFFIASEKVVQRVFVASQAYCGDKRRARRLLEQPLRRVGHKIRLVALIQS
jgi:hypothetical protein